MDRDKEQNTLLIGCFADCISGAAEVASFFAEAGLQTLLLTGPPTDNALPQGVEAVVFPLEIDGVAAAKAADLGKEAYALLKAAGAKIIYFKMSSLFSLGAKAIAVANRILKEYRIPYTALCPSLPALGFTTENGVALRDGVPIVDLRSALSEHGKHPGFILSGDLLSGRAERREQYLVEKNWKYPHYYILPDHTCDEDAALFLDAFPNLSFFAGGSGLADFLARRLSGKAPEPRDSDRLPAPGRCMVLVGSRSPAVVAQIKAFIDAGNPSYQIDSRLLRKGVQSVDALIGLIKGSAPRSVLLYGSGVLESDSLEDEPALGGVLEKTMGVLAQRAAEIGITSLIVAGESTCRSVMGALGATSLSVGTGLLPGIAAFALSDHPSLRLAIQPGDYDDPNLFLSIAKRLKASE